ncbi:MAG: hypothetical protein IJK23_09855 [Clostridia bacterium]|nr:hypothetical protein [Clostridia bacterium]
MDVIAEYIYDSMRMDDSAGGWKYAIDKTMEYLNLPHSLTEMLKEEKLDSHGRKETRGYSLCDTRLFELTKTTLQRDYDPKKQDPWFDREVSIFRAEFVGVASAWAELLYFAGIRLNRARGL